MALSTVALGAGAVLTAAPAQADGPSRDELLNICDGGRSEDGEYRLSECVFEAGTESPQTLDWHRYGEPVTNCAPGATQTISSLVGSTRTETESWTVGGGIKIELKPITIEGKSDYSNSRSTTTERRDTITTPPGRKNALTAGVGFVEQTGRFRVVTEFGIPGETTGGVYVTFYVDEVNRRVPTGYTEKGQDEVGCDSKFTIDPEP